MMAYWHKLATDGWICPDCGLRQHGEYYCEDCAEMEREIEDQRQRNEVFKAVIAREGFLSPQERRQKLRRA